MIYGSVCSGIEAATVAWHPLGWKPAFFSEIEPFPRAVLQHHYPDTPLHGDFTTIEPGQYAAIDLLVGGTPCQDFSVAGLRAGLDGERGNLSLEYLKLAERLRPRWLVWENVPGVLSINDGRAFGAIVGGLVQLGYHCAYRILDAQYFGVPQRRRRVFLVGYFGDWRCSAAVLFERESLSGGTAPSREARETTVRGIEIGPSGGGFTELAPTLDARCRDGFIRNQLGVGAYHADVAPTVSSSGPPYSRTGNERVETEALVACVAPSLTAFNMDSRSPQSEEQQRIVGAVFAASSAVRRLTPRECERLQGFPDDYTLVPYRGKPASDGPRYKALGNSMAVPCMAWIGERIAMVEQIIAKEKAA